jgi:hypothetical protein
MLCIIYFTVKQSGERRYENVFSDYTSQGINL